jgi:hypothetical protein
MRDAWGFDPATEDNDKRNLDFYISGLETEKLKHFVPQGFFHRHLFASLR